MASHSSRLFQIAICLALPWLASCTPAFPPAANNSPFKEARLPPGAVVLDIYSIRFPFGDEEVNGSLWREIDEQHLPPEVRRRLACNGFRVGLVGGQIPETLSRLMELKDKPAPNSEANTVNGLDMETAPRVMWNHQQLSPGKPGKIAVSREYERLALLLNESGETGGGSYVKAQGILTVRSTPLPDGRVRLEIVPELEHGDYRRQIGGSQGRWETMKMAKNRRTFDSLKVSATLNPGEMIVFSSLPALRGSLGHHFFTSDVSGVLEQRLLVIRLSQTQHNTPFDMPEVLPLDELEELDE